jgi:hypothetical protein
MADCRNPLLYPYHAGGDEPLIVKKSAIAAVAVCTLPATVFMRPARNRFATTDMQRFDGFQTLLQ